MSVLVGERLAKAETALNQAINSLDVGLLQHTQDAMAETHAVVTKLA